VHFPNYTNVAIVLPLYWHTGGMGSAANMNLLGVLQKVFYRHSMQLKECVSL
jgi:hypothetical protein